MKSEDWAAETTSVAKDLWEFVTARTDKEDYALLDFLIAEYGRLMVEVGKRIGKLEQELGE